MKTFSFQLSIDIGNEVREQNKFLGEMVFEFYYVYIQSTEYITLHMNYPIFNVFSFKI